MKNFNELYKELLMLVDPRDKYEWIIDYGGGGQGISYDKKIDDNLVLGFNSRIWVIKTGNNFYCEAELPIVDGFASIICDWWNQANSDQRDRFSVTELAKVGLMPLMGADLQSGIINLIYNLIKMFYKLNVNLNYILYFVKYFYR